MLELLTGDPVPAKLPKNVCLLYNCSNMESFVKQMPLCDEWGLRPEGLGGHRGNPVLVTPLLVDPAVRAPNSGVEGRALPDTPEAVGEEESTPCVPEEAAPRASACAREVTRHRQARPIAAGEASPASPASASEATPCPRDTEDRAPALGLLRPNLEVLRKNRKLRCHDIGGFRPLKQRKCIAVKG